MKIAVVTGASSGLGREFVRQISGQEKELEQIWVIARRRERLEKLQELSGVPIRALSVELFGRRITVTAVWPYWVRDTEFIPTTVKPKAVPQGTRSWVLRWTR